MKGIEWLVVLMVLTILTIIGYSTISKHSIVIDNTKKETFQINQCESDNLDKIAKIISNCLIIFSKSYKKQCRELAYKENNCQIK